MHCRLDIHTQNEIYLQQSLSYNIDAIFLLKVTLPTPRFLMQRHSYRSITNHPIKHFPSVDNWRKLALSTCTLLG